MRLIAPILLACAACTPAGADADEPAAARAYATQIDVPSPDYRKLLARPPVQPKGEIVREASAPLPADAKAVGDLWVERLEAKNALMGHGLAGKSPDGPVNHIDTLLTAKEFDAWVAQNGWSPPKHIRWYFQSELVAPRVSDAAEPKIRIWPASQARTGWQLEALIWGRVVLKDGCLWIRQPGQPERLAWFHAETGLDVDSEGYLILLDRATGHTMARIGEEMTAGGPNTVPESDPGVAALRAACGDAEIYNIGNPQSKERMYVEYPHLREPLSPPLPPPRP